MPTCWCADVTSFLSFQVSGCWWLFSSSQFSVSRLDFSCLLGVARAAEEAVGVVSGHPHFWSLQQSFTAVSIRAWTHPLRHSMLISVCTSGVLLFAVSLLLRRVILPVQRDVCEIRFFSDCVYPCSSMRFGYCSSVVLRSTIVPHLCLCAELQVSFCSVVFFRFFRLPLCRPIWVFFNASSNKSGTYMNLLCCRFVARPAPGPCWLCPAKKTATAAYGPPNFEYSMHFRHCTRFSTFETSCRSRSLIHYETHDSIRRFQSSALHDS